MGDWQRISEGDSNAPPSLSLDPGHEGRLTLSLPFEVPAPVAGAVGQAIYTAAAFVPGVAAVDRVEVDRATITIYFRT